MSRSTARPAASDASSRVAAHRLDAWLAGVAWLVVVGSALQILTFSFGRDQGIYAVVADGLLAGKMPYRDVWDFKPPGIFLVYALAQALFGKSMLAPRLLEVLALFGSLACMRRIAGVMLGHRSIGLIGGAVAALIAAELDFWHTGQPETFGAFFTLLGITLSVEEPRKRRWLYYLGVGLSFGLAALMKPPLGGGALVCAAWLLRRRQRDGLRWSGAAASLGWIGLGGALPVALTLLWFGLRGALPAAYWTLGEFVPGYTALTWQGARVTAMLYQALVESFFHFSALAPAGLIATIAMRPAYDRERECVLLFLGVIATHVVGVAMQAKFFPYHYAATLPLIAFLAGIGLSKLWRRCLEAGLAGVLLFSAFVAVAVPMRYAVRDLPQFFWERGLIRLSYLLRVAPYDSRDVMDAELAYVADYNLWADRQVAAEIRATTPPDASIFVWGFEPAIYWLSERAPASRFIYNVAQRGAWQQERARRELLNDLAASRPAAIVVQRRDVFPFVTGSAADSERDLESFPELRALLDTQYEAGERIEDFAIYRRSL